MPKISQRGAAELQHSSVEQLLNVDWNDLRVLLACASGGTFRAAARVLRIDSATVTRRIKRLERALGTRLFVRVPEGVVLTEEGNVYVNGARQVERAMYDLSRKHGIVEQTEQQTVTVAITEGLGSYWVMPKLIAFQREHPNLSINLLCAMTSVDVLRLEADVAIQFTKPRHLDLIVRRVGRLHLYPFAAPSYLRTYGKPKKPSDFVHHRFVQQIAPQLDDSSFCGYFGIDADMINIGVRTNASTAHLYAIERGAGIGVLPNYAAALGAPIVAVDVASRYHLDIWMTYHSDMKLNRGVSEVIKWLRHIFDPEIYPWFGDRFIHPNQLAATGSEEGSIDDGRGYLATDPSHEFLRRIASAKR